MSERLETALRALLWALLGGWLGALVLFSTLVAPAAFEVLGREPAGRLVRQVLPPLLLYGVAAGAVLAGLARILGRGALATFLPLALACLGLWVLFGITPQMEEVRGRAFGPPADPAALARFTRLHAAAGAAYLVIAVGAFALVVVHARLDVAAARGKKTPAAP